MDSAKRVLIIDDDVEFVGAAQRILRGDSIEVSWAKCCDEGMLVAERLRPDAIVLEAMLPDGTEGFHFIWDLRQHPDPGLRGTPVVVVSRINDTIPFHLSLSDQDWEYGAGEFLPAQCFLDKPVEPEVLLARVRGVLGQG